jgi:PKD repeat protein
VDEWYNYQQPDGAVVGGGGTDFSPRAAGVHVLATVDESTYDEDDGNTTDDDHPISWCHRYDGGRSWYTGMGHTAASFSEAPFLKHLLGGIEVAAGAVSDPDCGTAGSGNHAPTVDAQRNPSGDVSPGDPVAFTAQGTDADGDTLTYEWDFGDGAVASTKDALHTYDEVGVFTAKVTVRDGKGGQGTALLQVNVQPVGDGSEEVGVGGLVPGVLGLEITGSANFGLFMPGVTKDYEASLAAKVTSSATAAELTVRDPSANHTGHLVNGSSFLAQPLQVRATDADHTSTAFAPLPETVGPRLSLLSFPTPVSGRPVTLGFKQSIAATESLATGGYGKTVVFTLSPTTP